MLNQASIIQDVANLNLSIFGIGITLLTVLISFAISKKDELKAYSDVHKSSPNTDLSLRGKIEYSIKYVRYVRNAIIHIAIISATSLISYILYWADKPLNCNWVVYIMIVITFVCVVYVLILLIRVMRFFWKYTKV